MAVTLEFAAANGLLCGILAGPTALGLLLLLSSDGTSARSNVM